jgi:hypothetical protein
MEKANVFSLPLGGREFRGYVAGVLVVLNKGGGWAGGGQKVGLLALLLLPGFYEGGGALDDALEVAALGWR